MNPAHLKSTAQFWLASADSIARDAVTCSKQAEQEMEGAHCPVEVLEGVVELTGYGRQHCHQVCLSCKPDSLQVLKLVICKSETSALS